MKISYFVSFLLLSLWIFIQILCFQKSYFGKVISFFYVWKRYIVTNLDFNLYDLNSSKKKGLVMIKKVLFSPFIFNTHSHTHTHTHAHTRVPLDQAWLLIALGCTPPTHNLSWRYSARTTTAITTTTENNKNSSKISTTTTLQTYI